jgi:hypothetical protein
VNNERLTVNDKAGILSESVEQTKTITLNWLQDILTLDIFFSLILLRRIRINTVTV